MRNEGTAGLVGRLRPHPHLAPRLQSYIAGFLIRQQKALASVFRSVVQAVGERRFRELSQAYVLQTPSQNPALEFLGVHFENFLAGHTPAWVVQLARLDWARNQALLAPPSPSLSLTELERAGFSQAQLHFAADFQLVSADPMAWQIWSKELESPSDFAGAALWRRGFQVRHIALGHDEFRLLHQLSQGATVAEVLEPLSETALPQTVQQFQRWFQRGWIRSASTHIPQEKVA